MVGCGLKLRGLVVLTPLAASKPGTERPGSLRPWLPVKRPRSRLVSCAVTEYMIWSLLSLSSNVCVSGQSGLLVAHVTVRVCVVREGATPPKNHSLFCRIGPLSCATGSNVDVSCTRGA